jgi:hypothetical protein
MNRARGLDEVLARRRARARRGPRAARPYVMARPGGRRNLARRSVSRETFPVQRRRPNAPAVRCKRCPTMTANPRKGCCPRCYQRDYHGRELELACATGCGQGDPRTLVRKTLAGEMHTLCGNCSTIAGRRPLSLEDLRAEVLAPGDRRGGDRRRRDRRGSDRRGRLELVDDERRGRDRRARAA